MKEETRVKLDLAYQDCKDEDKSSEYTLQYLQDIAGVDFDCALNYFIKKDEGWVKVK